MAQLLLEQGCYNAMHLDGGGSTTMIAKSGGQLKLMNRPSDGAQRQVANGILVVGYDEKQPGIGGAYHTPSHRVRFYDGGRFGNGNKHKGGHGSRRGARAGADPAPRHNKGRLGKYGRNHALRSHGDRFNGQRGDEICRIGPSLLPIMMIAGCAAVSVGAAGYLLWWKKRRLR